MAIYAIGDIQGCAVALEELLDDIRFDPDEDQLWLTGDLVNRGPDSLQTLRMLRGFGRSVTSILGNHDLHLLAVASGVKEAKPNDTLKQILQAPDADELIDWIRHMPLVHTDRSLRTMMVHAGVYPGWGARKLRSLGKEAEQVLRGNSSVDFFREMYGRKPDQWNNGLHGFERIRFIVNALTRMRFITTSGRLDFDHKGPPGSQPGSLIPWYLHPELRCRKWRVVFGHWSALGFIRSGRVIGLDSGCVWGGALTAVRLDGSNPRQCWQVGCSI